MLLIAFAAVVGVVLGRFFRVASLAPGAAATMILAFVVEWSIGASWLTLVVVVALCAVSLQLGYLVSSLSARPISRLHSLCPHAPNGGKVSGEL